MTTPELSTDDLLRDRAWIVNIARVLVRGKDTGEDVAQDVWVAALRHPPKRREHVRAWFNRVARNRARDLHRSSVRRVRREAVAARPAWSDEHTADALVERVRLQGIVARAVAELQDPYRHTILLRYFKDQSVADIAELEDISQATVRTRLRRGHASLRRRLSQLTGECESDWRQSLVPLAVTTRADALHTSTSGTGSLVALGGTTMAAHLKSGWLIAGALVAGLIGGMLGVLVAGPLQGENDGNRAQPMLEANRDETARSAATENPTLTAASPEGDDRRLRDDIDQIMAQLAALEVAYEKDRLSQETIDRAYKLSLRVLQERARANETAAVATSRNAVSAQAQFQHSAKVDTDGDGTGEYGGFMELSGATNGRMRAALVPPVLSRTFRGLSENGEVLRNGYYYRVYLPDANGQGIGEPQEGFTDQSGIDADLSETTWCMYAWPEEYGVTGTKTFMVNQGGDTFATDDRRYSGSGNGPKPNAAFTTDGIVGSPKHDKRGNDGNVWKQRG